MMFYLTFFKICAVLKWGLGGFAPDKRGVGDAPPLAVGTQTLCLPRFSGSSTAALIAYQTADSEEFLRGSSAYIYAYNANTFCYRQRVPKAFGRIATHQLFPLYRCISFLKKYRQGYNEKGVTSDTLRGREVTFASNLSLTSRELADASPENLCILLLRHNAIFIIYP